MNGTVPDSLPAELGEEELVADLLEEITRRIAATGRLTSVSCRFAASLLATRELIRTRHAFAWVNAESFVEAWHAMTEEEQKELVGEQ